MNKFQSLLIRERERRNLSVRKASELIQISHTYLNALEKGVDTRGLPAKNPTPETLKMIAAAYDISYNHLMALCGYIENSQDLSEIGDIYLRMAREAQEMKLDEEDIDTFIAVYRRHKEKNNG